MGKEWGSKAGGDIERVPIHGGRYFQYNVSGVVFELPAKYSPIRLLGRGGSAFVCAATNLQTGEKVAIKKIIDSLDDAKGTLREIKLLRHMDHVNVIAIKDVIRPLKREDLYDVYIVYELMNTDLCHTIHSSKALTDEHCQYLMYQLLRGLKYVHSASVLHRDLKPGNLLLNTDCSLKIGDFGQGRIISQTGPMTKCIGTIWYRAPELLLGCSDYTAAIDIWSVGCILGEIGTRQPIFRGKSKVDQLELITKLLGSPDDSSLDFLQCDKARSRVKKLPMYPKKQFSASFPSMSLLATDMMERMLVFDPRKRITVDEALHHPYLQDFHDRNDEPVCTRALSFEFEQQSYGRHQLMELIWREALEFNPDPVA